MITKSRPFKWIFAAFFLASISFACSNSASEESESTVAEPEEMMEAEEELPPLDSTVITKPETKNL
jgi:hypothetical protein